MYFEWFFTLNLSLNVQNNDVVQAVYIYFFFGFVSTYTCNSHFT